MLKKDKQKVIGEDLSDERVKSLLDYNPHGDINADFHVLTKAYRALRPHDFERFVAFFKEDGRDINATDKQGNTFLTIVSQHQQLGSDYVEILKAAGAK